MRHSFWLAWLLVIPNVFGKLVQDDRTPAIAMSGGVEISSLDIRRAKASYAAKGADLTYMQIDFWFTDKKWNPAKSFLATLTHLEPIMDNTGKTLSTKDRTKQIAALQAEVQLASSQSFLDKLGPILTVTLEAPERHATSIKAIKGKAVVSRVEFHTLQFSLSETADKPLKHPRLKDFRIVPSIQVRDGFTDVRLLVPLAHARIQNWYLEGKDEDIRLFSEGGGGPAPAGSINLRHTYRGVLPKGTLLVVIMATPVDTKTFDFSFENVSLP